MVEYSLVDQLGCRKAVRTIRLSAIYSVVASQSLRSSHLRKHSTKDVLSKKVLWKVKQVLFTRKHLMWSSALVNLQNSYEALLIESLSSKVSGCMPKIVPRKGLGHFQKQPPEVSRSTSFEQMLVG